MPPDLNLNIGQWCFSTNIHRKLSFRSVASSREESAVCRASGFLAHKAGLGMTIVQIGFTKMRTTYPPLQSYVTTFGVTYETGMGRSKKSGQHPQAWVRRCGGDVSRCVSGRPDTREGYGEERWIGTGMIQGRCASMAFAQPEDDTIRVISLRKANRE